MMTRMKQDFQDQLRKAFESGYSNAAVSLSKMINDKTHASDLRHGLHPVDSIVCEGFAWSARDHESILLTTELFGEITGKSYFFLSGKEFEFLTAAIPKGKNSAINLKEEFAKELDNILSASVITRLSNELKVKMYGDIPILVGKTAARIEDIIMDDFGEQAEQLYVNSTFFIFENNSGIKPHFIWVMDSRVLRNVEAKIGETVL